MENFLPSLSTMAHIEKKNPELASESHASIKAFKKNRIFATCKWSQSHFPFEHCPANSLASMGLHLH